MGRTISYCHQILERQLETPYRIFPIYAHDPETDLHNQYSRRVSPSNPEGNQKQGSISKGYSSGKTRLSGLSQHPQKMDHAINQLGGNFTTSSHKIWREVSVDVNLRSLGRVVPTLPHGRPRPMSFLGIRLTLTQFI